ncbi:MAG TPA: capsular polysaccharide synthesis protein [Acidimicrobiales bacterium]|nr:capsular polysaccharide synthesis protein [Acidimicrobiales bacterium]
MTAHGAADIVWMYWENTRRRKVRAPYLDLCIETIRRNAGTCDVRLLDVDSAMEWVPDMDEETWRGLQSPVHRSDYLRTRLIHRYGGLWLDVDTIALHPLSEITALLRQSEVVGWGRELEGHFYSNFFAANPGALLIADWIRAQDDILRTRGLTGLDYADLGYAVNELAKHHEYCNLPMERVAPVPWFSWRQFTSHAQNPRRVLRADPYLVILWNKAMNMRLRDEPAEVFLYGTTLLSRLLRIGLHLSTVEDEARGLARFDALGRMRFTTIGRSVEFKVRAASSSVGKALRPAPGR